MTWVVLLEPWAGFDEPYHQGYVEANVDRLAWPGFRGITLPDSLVDAMRQWPLPPRYAEIFSARQYGESRAPTVHAFHDTNYETQQSPLYYAAAGLFLRALPKTRPIFEMYLLRLVNAGMALGVGVLLWRAARQFHLRWLPVALLAFIPGFGVAMCRVSNDALCALLISIGVAGALASDGGGWRPAIGSLAAGLAPWAKLYGLAALPGSVFREATRPGSSGVGRWTRGFLVVMPSITLAICSLRIFGQAIPIMYNIRGAPAARLLAVPWIRSAWAVAKTHVWVSGMSFLVFPTWLYVLPLALLVWGLSMSLGDLRSSKFSRSETVILAAPVLLFVLALAYQEWRGFSYYGGPGGSGGWYAWAVALPELILLTYGASRREMIRSWIVPVLSVFLVVTVLGDLASICESAGILKRTANGHIQGVSATSLSHLAVGYAQSRPIAAAVAGAVGAVASWCLGCFFVARVYKISRVLYQN